MLCAGVLMLSGAGSMPEASKPALGMILKGYPRISETFISNEIQLLEQHGFNIHIFSMRQPRERFFHPGIKKIRANVDYLPENILPNLARLLRHNISLAGKIPATYAKALNLALRRFGRTFKSATIKHLLQAGYLVEHLLPKVSIGHLHAHFAHSPTSVAMFTSLLTGIPFSFTAHAKDIYTSNTQQLGEKIAGARFVATCTEYNRRYLQRIAQRNHTPIHRVYHGIDLDLFAGIPSAPKPPAAPYRILTVARMTAKKGLPTVYRALRRLYDQGMVFQHTLIGDGDDRKLILALIAKLGLGPVTRCLGTQPHDVVLQHYQAADLFVLGCEVAQNGDRDGIPNVFPESMAMGVPVVATRVSAIPEIIRDGQTGLLVTPGRPQEMAQAIERLLTDYDLRRRIIGAALQLVQREFDNRILIRDLVQIYGRRMQGPGA